MIECLISLIIWCIVAAILLYVVEAVLGSFLPVPAQVLMLVRVLVGLLVLLAVIDCFGLLDGGLRFPFRRGAGGAGGGL